jgi:hypothetical protein
MIRRQLVDKRKLGDNLRVFLYAPTGIRTPVLALKGLRPSPLDDGGVVSNLAALLAPCR